MMVTNSSTTTLTQQIVSIGIDNLISTIIFNQNLRIVTVLINDIARRNARLGLAAADAIGIVAIAGGNASLRCLGQLVSGIVAIGACFTTQRFTKRITIVIVGVGGSSLLRQAVIIIVAEGRRNTVDDLLGSDAYSVIAVAGVVISVTRIADAFCGEAVQFIIGIALSDLGKSLGPKSTDVSDLTLEEAQYMIALCNKQGRT